MNTENWKKEFDKMWDLYDWHGGENFLRVQDQVKMYIHNLIIQEKQKWEDKLKYGREIDADTKKFVEMTPDTEQPE